jgi:hypothetical protein
MLADGRELARFTGPDAKRRALRYVATVNSVRRGPTLDAVRAIREERDARPEA